MPHTDINFVHSDTTPESSSRVEVFNSIAEALKVYPRFKIMPAGGIFETLSWFETLIAHGTERPESAWVLVCGDASHAILLPLQTHNGQVSALSNYYASLYGPVVYGAGDLQVKARALARWFKRQNLNTLNFRPMNLVDDFWVAMRTALRESGFLVDAYFCFANWYLPCEEMRWSEYLAARPSRLKNTIIRSRKKLEASVDFEYVIVREPGDALDRAIENYETVYARSWKQPEPFASFILNLCHAAAANGWLRLGIAKLSGQPVAAQIWFVKDGVASIYKLAYDEAFASRGVGTVLTAALFEYCLDQDRVREIDFLTGDESYKAEWMSRRRAREGVIAFNPTTLHGLLNGGAHFGSRLTAPLLGFTAKARFGKTNKHARTEFVRDRGMKSTTTSTSNVIEALVVGLCAHGLTLTRALHRNGVPVFAFEQHNRNPGLWTNSAHVIQVADINGDALIQDLIDFARSRPHKRPILFLTNDRMTETVARHVDHIREYFDLSWSDNVADIVALLNKSNIESR
ncbi:MAG TPA: GNAT family N-acetyltransferase, partial [Burkholderiales bacterium]|nr:GNAT family N-acetyltransferase [Burkholderiales bacterium]